MIFEVCVDSVESALAAQQGGADRVELCDDLVEGGTTPSQGMIKVARKLLSIGLHVMIRPRGGDFCYTELEYEVMLNDVADCRSAGADGIVLGILLPDGRVDTLRTRQIVEAARPLSVTFHRAFDMTRDAEEALETLMSLNIDRVLTSGQKRTAMEGADCIARMVRQAGRRMTIMAGGGVNAENIRQLVAATGVSECHFSARRCQESPMVYRNLYCSMGKAYQPDEYSCNVTDAIAVRHFIDTALNHWTE